MESVKPELDALKHEISGRFRVAREALRLTPPQMAAEMAKTGLVKGSAQTVRDYEGEKSIPGGATLVAMRKLGVNVDFVLFGEGPALLDSGGQPGTVQEPGVAYAASPALLDAVLLQQVIDFFHRWLADNGNRVRIPAAKHAAIITVLYKSALLRGKAEDADLAQVLSIAA
ncbi:hypothetical protein DLREEDagrD3_28580 [Denitratisoma sp. agr-D3]